MSKILFFTDPHIGVSRTTNTTMASAKALRDRIYNDSMDILGSVFAEARICLGDLFERHSNPEPVVAQGANIARSCSDILGGNHDVKNVVGALSSLGLIQKMMEDNSEEGCSPVILNPDLTKPYYAERTYGVGEGRVYIYFIPHCLTQELFEESVRLACSQVTPSRYNILCLHCNVGDAYGQVEAEGSTLSLTDDLQADVVTAFDLTLVGHEHTPQKYHKGKIVVMGNLLPLSFGELSNRYHYILDTETKKLEMQCHFDADEEVQSFNVRDLDTLDSFGQASYVTIGGEIKPEGYPAMARQIQKIWSNSPRTLMVSNVVEIDRPDALSRQRVDASKQTLVDLVRAEAKGKGFETELAELEKVQ
jgi:DNA repair exonuclease SbcCD nuclease subunit